MRCIMFTQANSRTRTSHDLWKRKKCALLQHRKVAEVMLCVMQTVFFFYLIFYSHVAILESSTGEIIRINNFLL